MAFLFTSGLTSFCLFLIHLFSINLFLFGIRSPTLIKSLSSLFQLFCSWCNTSPIECHDMQLGWMDIRSIKQELNCKLAKGNCIVTPSFFVQDMMVWIGFFVGSTSHSTRIRIKKKKFPVIDSNPLLYPAQCNGEVPVADIEIGNIWLCFSSSKAILHGSPTFLFPRLFGLFSTRCLSRYFLLFIYSTISFGGSLCFLFELLVSQLFFYPLISISWYRKFPLLAYVRLHADLFCIFKLIPWNKN